MYIGDGRKVVKIVVPNCKCDKFKWDISPIGDSRVFSISSDWKSLDWLSQIRVRTLDLRLWNSAAEHSWLVLIGSGVVVSYEQ